MQSKVNMTPALLMILDGFGCRDEMAGNAITLATKPNWDKLLRTCPHTTISASGASVGLPDGQMGNSETGHLNIGAGRVVHQEFTRINRAIESGAFFTNQTLIQVVKIAKDDDKALHIMGLLSDGGVHSHENHIHAMIEMATRAGIKHIYLHAFLDGRDTPPRSAETFLLNVNKKFQELGTGRIATISGRYYAMDRNKNWGRVKLVYDMLTDMAQASPPNIKVLAPVGSPTPTLPRSPKNFWPGTRERGQTNRCATITVTLGQTEFAATDAVSALKNAYARGENDEFVKPTIIGDPVPIRDGDVVVFMNFRADRAREIARAFIEWLFC